MRRSARGGGIHREVTEREHVLREPLPSARAILWKPLPDSYHLLASMMRTPEQQACLFVTQRAFLQVERHLRSGLDLELGGFLAGQLYECPRTRVRYAVVNTVVPFADVSEDPIGSRVTPEAFDKVHKQLLRHRLSLIGWYRNGNGLGLQLLPDDVETQLTFFKELWQVTMIVVQTATKSKGAFFTYDPRVGRSYCIPFYELFDTRAAEAKRLDRTCVNWATYLPVGPVQPLAGTEKEIVETTVAPIRPVSPEPAPPEPIDEWWEAIKDPWVKLRDVAAKTPRRDEQPSPPVWQPASNPSHPVTIQLEATRSPAPVQERAPDELGVPLRPAAAAELGRPSAPVATSEGSRVERPIAAASPVEAPPRPAASRLVEAPSSPAASRLAEAPSSPAASRPVEATPPPAAAKPIQPPPPVAPKRIEAPPPPPVTQRPEAPRPEPVRAAPPFVGPTRAGTPPSTPARNEPAARVVERQAPPQAPVRTAPAPAPAPPRSQPQPRRAPPPRPIPQPTAEVMLRAAPGPSVVLPPDFHEEALRWQRRRRIGFAIAAASFVGVIFLSTIRARASGSAQAPPPAATEATDAPTPTTESRASVNGDVILALPVAVDSLSGALSFYREIEADHRGGLVGCRVLARAYQVVGHARTRVDSARARVTGSLEAADSIRVSMLRAEYTHVAQTFRRSGCGG